VSTDCYHLHDYEVTTAGDVPISFKLFVSGMKDSNGQWIIEQIRVLGLPVAWFSPDQGHDMELLRGTHEHVFPKFYVEQFLKKFLRSPSQYSRLCEALNREVLLGRVRRIV
jgi:hypothetical protein